MHASFHVRPQISGQTETDHTGRQLEALYLGAAWCRNPQNPTPRDAAVNWKVVEHEKPLGVFATDERVICAIANLLTKARLKENASEQSKIRTI